jgi:tRNA modification GTPase
MFDYSLDDTIIAVSTPLGRGGIGIVRLSGDSALPIALKIFRPKKAGSRILPGRAVLGNLVDPERKEPFEEAYLIHFRAPHSYTTQSVVEISCHGSPVVLEEVLRLGTRFGARLARPGEFTFRAYRGGRIDILQAEAVDDLIRAPNIEAARKAFGHLDGGLSARMAGLRRRIVEILGLIEAAIEFPDEKLPVSPRNIEAGLEEMTGYLDALIAGYDAGRALLEGVTLAIVGRANVGKSTLFNALLAHERAIVTPFPGTTRDFLREKVRIKDVDFNLVDMAGLRRAATAVEKEGIRRSREIAAQADGILFLFDASKKDFEEDLTLLDEFKDKKAVLVFNKIDLGRKPDLGKVRARIGRRPFLEISALRGTNLERLKAAISKTFAPRNVDRGDVIFHLRQKLALEDMGARLRRAKRLLSDGHPEEMYVEEIREIVPALGRFLGEIRSDDVLADIFGRFCVGK